MKKIHINFMNNLRNGEFAKLYKQICSNIDAEKLPDEHVKRFFLDITRHLSDIGYIGNDPRSHELTCVMNEQTRIRTDYLISLRRHLDAKMYSQEERSTSKVLISWLEQQGEKLYVPSINLQSRLVENLMHVRKMDSKISEALTFLDIEKYLLLAFDLTKEIDLNFECRTHDMAARTKKARFVRKAAYHDLKIFVDQLNIFTEKDKYSLEDNIYHVYNREINSLLMSYRTALKSRTIKRKNKNETTDAVKKLIENYKENARKEEEKKNLPMVIYDQLKNEHSTSSGNKNAREAGNEVAVENAIDDKEKEIDDTKNVLENLSVVSNDKRKGEKDGGGTLPPFKQELRKV